jgi:hypothetical protein
MLGSLWFSTRDFKSGYYQVAMSPASVEDTAFVTPDGHYEFLRLPFGLKNSPSHFSKIMVQALGDLNFVKIYLDDITILSKSFICIWSTSQQYKSVSDKQILNLTVTNAHGLLKRRPC